jgi:hypothetical protein
MSAPKIPEGRDWEIVRDAFRGARLDPSNPEHWVLLLRLYIETVNRRARAGRSREWTDERLIKLAADFSHVQHDHPGKSDSEICRRLARREGYSEVTAATLRRKLQDARDPKRNRSLARIIDGIAAEYEVEGGNTRERLREWATTGYTHYWEDKEGKLHSTPPEPPPADAPADWEGHSAIRLRKK